MAIPCGVDPAEEHHRARGRGRANGEEGGALSIALDVPLLPMDARLAGRCRRDAGALVRVPEDAVAVGWIRGVDGLPRFPPAQDLHPGQVAWWVSLAYELTGSDRWARTWMTSPGSTSWWTGRTRVVATEPAVADVCGGLGDVRFLQPRVTYALAWGVADGPGAPRLPIRCRGAAVAVEDGQGILVLADGADAAGLARWLPPGG